jgi:hypothetical protein
MIFVFSDFVRDAVQQFHKVPVIRVSMRQQTSVWPRSFLNCKELCPEFVENR